MNTSIKSAASALGRRGGKAKTTAKAKAAKANGRRGGRPAIDIQPLLDAIAEGGAPCQAAYYRAQYADQWRKAVRLGRINKWRDDTGVEFVEVVK